ncbi:MAG TPA: C45 family peptidase, partial [Planctomycetota bacterium]|nr:C45 family peptidase [Planctomycetota bacterium]
WQLIDEMWAQMPLLFAHKCTTVGVDRDGDRPAFVAQNMDLPRWMHAYPTVLRIRYPDRELQSLVVTVPGVVGANGINDHRVAVCVNTVLQIRACRDGLPVAFVVRGLLEQPDHAAALAFLQQVPHASGQAYTVGGPDTAPCFECSAGRKVRFEPFADAHRTWHTNHPLVSDDWSEIWLAHLAGTGKQPGELPFVCPRFATAAEQLREGAAVDVDKVKALLASKAPAGPICNPGTYVCTVMVLGAAPELHIAPGPPDRTPFQTLTFAVPR